MFKNNRNLLIIALIAVVNALGYGIIIPILYSYSRKFGLSDLQNGLLFALFSLCQFISTPLIGRLSDKYGRKPLLVISIAGTAVSFFIMAFAPSAIFLFLARALDGITAGNIPVASAVISDTTEPKDRAKGFGIIGASFGFGFAFGPAISGLTVSYGMYVPFVIAGIISLIAVLLTALFLPETNKHMGEVKTEKIFDFGKLFHALFNERIGTTLLITLIFAIAFSMSLIFGFQPFAVRALHMTPSQISLTFTFLGVVGLITQVFILPRIVKAWGEKKALHITLIGLTVGMLGMFFSKIALAFIPIILVTGFSNSSINPILQTILSKETDEKSQGTMQGFNASFMSIGMIIGPIVGGLLATLNLSFPFLAGSIAALVCFFLSFKVLKANVKRESAF